jgi:hypothetical protein
MEVAKAFEEFSTPLNYNQIIMYTATFTTYAVNYLVCPYTLERNTIEICYWCTIPDHYFGRVRYLLEGVILYHFTGKHNYFEESRKFCSTL